jgi:hypothetical protein
MSEETEVEVRIEESEARIKLAMFRPVAQLDVIIITVPKTLPLTEGNIRGLRSWIRGVFPQNKCLVKPADWNVDILADMLTPEDLDRLAKRMERKKLSQPIPPEQHDIKRPFSGE